MLVRSFRAGHHGLDTRTLTKGKVAHLPPLQLKDPPRRSVGRPIEPVTEVVKAQERGKHKLPEQR